jgi:hypothetical protein
LLGLIPIVGGVLWVLTAILGLGLMAVAARRRQEVVEARLTPPPAPV